MLGEIEPGIAQRGPAAICASKLGRPGLSRIREVGKNRAYPVGCQTESDPERGFVSNRCALDARCELGQLAVRIGQPTG
jgi:hypothetical protein